ASSASVSTPRISFASSDRPRACLATARTCAPSSEARRTISRPTPRLAPSTTTRLPCNNPFSDDMAQVSSDIAVVAEPACGGELNPVPILGLDGRPEIELPAAVRADAQIVDAAYRARHATFDRSRERDVELSAVQRHTLLPG